jgi:ResB-like family
VTAIARIFRPLASLRLTVVLLALSMILIFAGTLAQTREGVWTVVDRYFRSLVVVIPLRIFVPESLARVPGAVPFPGGLTLGVLLFFNLLGAHATRFKLSWKRAGMILTHLGVLLLLVGEFVTGALAREGNMSIDEGSSSNYVEDIRTSELAIIDPSDPGEDRVIVIPQRRLARRSDEPIRDPAMPFDVRVVDWMYNSRMVGPMQAAPAQLARATVGIGTQIAAVPVPRATGVDGSTVDVPAAYVSIERDGRSLGTYLVSPHFSQEQTVEVDARSYRLELRFERTYKPYSLHLIDFRHDKFLGTDTARNFSSLVRVVDPARRVDREVLISMNNPLRHAGETFYQSAFKPGDLGTVLQVVRNPGWLIPYVSCSMVTLGLLVHFGIRLGASARRRIA